ncbi:MAG: prepilin-type N-terminal cleavage/methylation domain-containing protein [Campylobacterales bacterium]|nr:prepilin-type N-terminal cleavage/methylation domain-containing protein [Campylobacterales bacterium]
MRKAFTLIELLIVFSMLALLMMLVAPSGLKILQSTQTLIAKVDETGAAELTRMHAFVKAQELNTTNGRFNSRGVFCAP